MSSLSDLDSVLDEAVRSYRIVKKLRLLKREARVDTIVESLAEVDFDNYISLDSYHRIKLEGKTPNEILEDFLQGLGYERCSDLWFSLAHIVIERGEREYDVTS
tara:strand:- start:3477 stop:3788 length:312 start_codon:yes stop_codon:yes gene_type:complete